MSFSDFFRSYGQVVEGAQKYALNQAQIEQARNTGELSKLKIEGEKAAAVQQKKILEYRDQTWGGLQKELQAANDPLQRASVLSKAATDASAHGDWDAAKDFRLQADESVKEAKEKRLAVAEKVQGLQKASANAALDYLANPNDNTAIKMFQAAVDSGVDHRTIPTQGGAALEKWARTRTMDGMEADERVKLMATEKDRAETREATRRRDENTQRHQRVMESNAAERLQLQGELTAARIDAAKSKATAGGPLEKFSTMTVNKVNLAIRDLERNQALKSTATTGVFAHLKDKDFTSAILAGGSTAISTDQAAMYNTNLSTLGKTINEIVSMRPSGTFQISQASTDAYDRAFGAKAGESEAVALYKYLSSVDTLRAAMDNTPPPSDPHMLGQYNKAKAWLDTMPSPDIVPQTLAKNGKGNDPTMRDMVRAAQDAEKAYEESAMNRSDGGKSRSGHNPTGHTEKIISHIRGADDTGGGIAASPVTSYTGSNKAIVDKYK